MLGQLPPFALAAPAFRFRALASQAGRAALGGDREIALACFAVARLAAGMLPPVLLAAGDAGTRAASVRHWLASLALPSAIRSTAGEVIDAIAVGKRRPAAEGLRALARAAGPRLDPQSHGEIEELAADLQG